MGTSGNNYTLLIQISETEVPKKYLNKYPTLHSYVLIFLLHQNDVNIKDSNFCKRMGKKSTSDRFLSQCVPETVNYDFDC